MDTWEVVLILLFLSISILVIANREVPLHIIEVLDNTYLQLVILAGALALAVLSPPVAIVAISTIVTVFYMRNVVKVQLMRAQRDAELAHEKRVEMAAEAAKAAAEAVPKEPRIEIRETTQTVTEIVADKEAIEAALQEHESRDSDVTNNGSSSTVPVGVESFEHSKNNNSHANVDGSRRLIGAVDSPVFTAARETPMGYNELKAPKKIRSYRDNAGQYDLDEMRPLSEVERYETADYMPSNDMGDNKFVPVGNSIDDKERILTSGLMPSSAPPPSFNSVDPKRSR
jgi:hypothetical protein